MVGIEPNNDNGLIKLSAADTFKIRSVAESRLIEKLGRVSDRDLALIEKGLAVVLRIR
jgi:mRNA interferase MazF